MKKKQLKKVSYLTLGVLSTTTIVVAPTLATTLKANSNVNHGVTDANVTTKTNVNHFNRLLTSDLATDTNQSLTLISGLVAGINWWNNYLSSLFNNPNIALNGGFSAQQLQSQTIYNLITSLASRDSYQTMLYNAMESVFGSAFGYYSQLTTIGNEVTNLVLAWMLSQSTYEVQINNNQATVTLNVAFFKQLLGSFKSPTFNIPVFSSPNAPVQNFAPIQGWTGPNANRANYSYYINNMENTYPGNVPTTNQNSFWPVVYAAQIWINKWLAYIIPSNLSHNEVTPDNIMKIVENNLLGFTVFYNKFISEENLHPIANAMNVLQIALQQGAKAVNIQNNNGKYQISINSQQLFGTSYPGIPSPTSVSYTPGAGYQLNKWFAQYANYLNTYMQQNWSNFLVANYAIFYSPTNVNNIKKFIKQLSLSDFTNWLKTQPANNFFDTYEYVTKDDKNSGQTAYQYFLENNSVAQPLFESLIQTGLSDNLISPIQISFTFNPQTAYLNSQIKEYVKNYNVQETLNAPSTYIYKFLTPQISLGNALYNNKNQITLNPTSDLTAQAAINSSNLSQTETQIKNALVNLFSSYWVGADQYFTAADANNITFSNITATSNNTVSLDVSYANQGLQYLNNNNEPVSLPLTIVTGFGNQTQPNKNDSQKIANSINHLLNNLSQPLTISGYQSQFLPTIAYNNSSANHDAVEQANTISALTQLVNNTLKNLSAQDSAGFNPKNVAVTINPQSLNNAQGTLSINVTYDGLNAGSNLTVHGFLTQSQQNTAIQAALNNALKNGINASSLSVTQSSLLSNTAMQVTLKNQALSLISSVLTNQQVNGQYINPSNLVFSNWVAGSSQTTANVSVTYNEILQDNSTTPIQLNTVTINGLITEENRNQKIADKIGSLGQPINAGNPNQTAPQAQSNPDTPQNIANKIAHIINNQGGIDGQPVNPQNIHVTPVPNSANGPQGTIKVHITIGSGPNAVPVNNGQPISIGGYQPTSSTPNPDHNQPGTPTPNPDHNQPSNPTPTPSQKDQNQNIANKIDKLGNPINAGNPDQTAPQAQSDPNTPQNIANKIAHIINNEGGVNGEPVNPNNIHVTPVPDSANGPQGTIKVHITIGSGPNAVPVNNGQPISIGGYQPTPATPTPSQKDQNQNIANKIDKLGNPINAGNPDETAPQAQSDPNTPQNIANKIAHIINNEGGINGEPVNPDNIHVTPVPDSANGPQGTIKVHITIGSGPNAVPVNNGQPISIGGYQPTSSSPTPDQNQPGSSNPGSSGNPSNPQGSQPNNPNSPNDVPVQDNNQSSSGGLTLPDKIMIGIFVGVVPAIALALVGLWYGLKKAKKIK